MPMPTQSRISESPQMFIERLEGVFGQELDEETKAEITLWLKGRALSEIVGFYGFEVILEMLRDYVNDATEKLVLTDPGSHADRDALHAVAFTSHRLYKALREDIDKAVTASRTTPSIVKSAAKHRRPAPIEGELD